MTDIRPIETRYRGYRFRSRLEARWAVFLDHLDIQYCYEDQGFVLKSGCYLPDFWLPQVQGFLEVKPRIAKPVHHFEFFYAGSSPIRDDLPRELVLAAELASSTKTRCCVVYGDPFDIFISADGAVISTTSKGLVAGILVDYLGNRKTKNAAAAARAARFESEDRLRPAPEVDASTQFPHFKEPNQIRQREWIVREMIRHQAPMRTFEDVYFELFGEQGQG